jgi:hypothetical protein
MRSLLTLHVRVSRPIATVACVSVGIGRRTAVRELHRRSRRSQRSHVHDLSRSRPRSCSRTRPIRTACRHPNVPTRSSRAHSDLAVAASAGSFAAAASARRQDSVLFSMQVFSPAKRLHGPTPLKRFRMKLNRFSTSQRTNPGYSSQAAPPAEGDSKDVRQGGATDGAGDPAYVESSTAGRNRRRSRRERSDPGAATRAGAE